MPSTMFKPSCPALFYILNSIKPISCIEDEVLPPHFSITSLVDEMVCVLWTVSRRLATCNKRWNDSNSILWGFFWEIWTKSLQLRDVVEIFWIPNEVEWCKLACEGNPQQRPYVGLRCCPLCVALWWALHVTDFWQTAVAAAKAADGVCGTDNGTDGADRR